MINYDYYESKIISILGKDVLFNKNIGIQNIINIEKK